VAAGCEDAKEMQRVYKRHQTDGKKECNFSDAAVMGVSLGMASRRISRKV
jgi:hypothetical protein